MTIRELFAAIGDVFISIGQFAHDFGSAFIDADLEVIAIQLAPFLLIVGFFWFVGKALQIHERRQIERYERQRERELEREWGELP